LYQAPWALLTGRQEFSYVDSRPLSSSQDSDPRHLAAGEFGHPSDLTFRLLLHLYLRPLPVSSTRWSWSAGRATLSGRLDHRSRAENGHEPTSRDTRMKGEVLSDADIQY
jgi:hypothetical protein